MSEQNIYGGDGTDDILTELPQYSNPGVCSSKFQSNLIRASDLDYDAVNDTIFALDEDSASLDLGGNVKIEISAEEKWNDFSDGDEFNLSKRTEAGSALSEIAQENQNAVPLRNAHSSTSLAISLPVNITNGVYQRNESLTDDEDELGVKQEEQYINSTDRCSGRQRAQTILSTREDRMYRNMQAYSRSIQPADDPERLFGERPHRRYRPADQMGDGINYNNDRFTLPSVDSMRMRGSCLVVSGPLSPIVANDLNIPGDEVSDNNIGSSTSGSVARPCVIVPSSFSGNCY